jgi:hypothetical protein
VGCVDRAPAVLGGLNELERHRHAGGAGPGALGNPLPQPDGGEGGFDRVGNWYERRWMPVGCRNSFMQLVGSTRGAGRRAGPAGAYVADSR